MTYSKGIPVIDNKLIPYKFVDKENGEGWANSLSLIMCNEIRLAAI
jgi:hypothetical protein